MLRVIFFLVLIIAAGLGFCWVNATKLPQWYEASAVNNATDPVAEFSRIIQKQGIEVFFKDKLSDLLAGKLRLNEEEFNALVLTSLVADDGGRLLLSVSDVLKTHVDQGNLEIGSVININKVKTQHRELVKKVPEFVEILTMLNTEKVYLAIEGQPLAIDGNLAFGENLSVKIGSLSIPNSLLSVLGMSVNKLQQQTIKLKNLFIKDIELSDKQIDMVVRPTF